MSANFENKKVVVSEIEELANGRARIIVTEIPYQVNKSKLVKQIATLIKEKKIDGMVFEANTVMGVGLPSELWLLEWLEKVKYIQIPD